MIGATGTERSRATGSPHCEACRTPRQFDVELEFPRSRRSAGRAERDERFRLIDGGRVNSVFVIERRRVPVFTVGLTESEARSARDFQAEWPPNSAAREEAYFHSAELCGAHSGNGSRQH